MIFRRMGGVIDESNAFADLIPTDSAVRVNESPFGTNASTFVPKATTPMIFRQLATLADTGDTWVDPARVTPAVMPGPVYVAPSDPAPVPVVEAPPPGATSAPAPTVASVPTEPVSTLPAATQIVRDTPGYQFQVQEGLDAINSNAYARGLGNSGVTFKALAEHGRKVADQYYQQYLANVAAVAEQGRGAAGAVAGAGDQMGDGVAGALNNQAQAYQNAANATANNAYQRANITAGVVGSAAGALGNIGAMLASSYKK